MRNEIKEVLVSNLIVRELNFERFDKLVDELTTLCKEQRADAVKGFAKYVDEGIAVDVPRMNMRIWAEEYLKEQDK